MVKSLGYGATHPPSLPRTQHRKWLPHHCLEQRGTKSEVATSPLPSKGPKSGR